MNAAGAARRVALLRGINVGGHRVKMDRLREIFSEMGFRDVSTFIASGNVIFEHDPADEADLAVAIEKGLAEALGYGVSTFLRTPAELERVIAFQPEGHDESRSLYITFFADAPDEEMRERVGALDSPSDRFIFDGRELYWSIAGKLSDSPLFGTGIERAISAPCTTRNITSLRRLVAKLDRA